MEKHRLGLLTKLVMISMMALVVVSVASAQTVFTRNGDFVITENLNVSGDINGTGDLDIGGILTGDGSGLTNLNVSIDDIDLSPITDNQTTLFGNVSDLRGDVLSLNDSINNLNASSPTDELQNVITSIGSQSGNFTTVSQTDAINLSGQDGGTSVTNTGNIFTFALNAINSIITSFTNFITFDSGIAVTGDAVITGNVTATSFIGDGSNLTGVIADNATFANSANQADNATFASGVNFNDITNLPDDFDGAWTSDGDNLYNDSATVRVGIGQSTPSARLDVVESFRVGSDANNNSFYQRDTVELTNVTAFTTVRSVTASTITDVSATWLVRATVQGDSNPQGSGLVTTEWTVGISGGAYTLTERMSDRIDDAPEFRLTSAGNTVNLQIASNSETNNLNGFATLEIYPSQGGSGSGQSISYTVS